MLVMSTRGRPSAADRELGEAIGVKDTQVRDWRDDGLIPGPRLVLHPDRPRRGGVYAYDEAARRQAVELARLLSLKRDATLATLMLFAGGYPVRERTVKEAYRRYLERLERWIRRLAPGAKSPTQVAERAAARLMKSRRTGIPASWKERASEQVTETAPAQTPSGTNDASLVLQRALATVLRIVLGAPNDNPSLLEAFEVGGLGAATREPILDGQPWIAALVDPTLRAVIKQFDFRSIHLNIESASIEELRWCASKMPSLVSMLAAVARLLTASTGSRDAAGLVVMAEAMDDSRWQPYGAELWIGVLAPVVMLPLRHVVADADVTLAKLLGTRKMLEATDRLVSSLPAEYRTPGGDARFAELSDHEQQELLEPWRQAHPDDVETLKAASQQSR